MKTPETRFCPTELGPMAYTDTGPGPAPERSVICMHGLPTSKVIFEPMRPHLDPRLRVITFDLHDHGESARPGRPIAHVERARLVDVLRAHLGLERFVLAAHDLGASVAVDYMALFGERVAKLVMMSPPVYPDFDEPAVVDLVRLRGLGELLLRLASDRLVDRSIRKGMAHPERYTPAIADALHRAYAGREGRAALMRNLRWGTPETTFAHYPRILRTIRTPTRVLQGAVDPYIPRGQAERLADDVSGAELVVIDDAAHFIQMDAPAAVAAEVNRFVFQ